MILSMILNNAEMIQHHDNELYEFEEEKRNNIQGIIS